MLVTPRSSLPFHHPLPLRSLGEAFGSQLYRQQKEHSEPKRSFRLTQTNLFFSVSGEFMLQLGSLLVKTSSLGRSHCQKISPVRGGRAGEDFAPWCWRHWWRLERVDMGTAVLLWEQRAELKPSTVQSSALNPQWSLLALIVSQRMAGGMLFWKGKWVWTRTCNSFSLSSSWTYSCCVGDCGEYTPASYVFVDLQSTFVKQNSFSRRNREHVTTDHTAVQWKTFEFRLGLN